MAKAKRRSTTSAAIRNPSKYLFDFSGWKNMTGEEYHRYRWNAHRFYYEETNPESLNNEVYKWMEDKYSKEQISLVNRCSLPPSVGILCKLIRSGAPDYNPKEQEYLDQAPGSREDVKPLSQYVTEWVEGAIEAGRKLKEEEEPKKKAPAISIQERMDQQVAEVVGELEGGIDDILRGKITLDQFRPYEILQNAAVDIKPAHAKRIQSMIEPELEEAREVMHWKEEWVKESYPHMKVKKRRETMYHAYNAIMVACGLIIGAGKSKRKPRKRSVNNEKLVSKMNFLEQDVKLKLTSVNPIEIIGASELWVYNIKSRKIGHYVADGMTGPLTVSRSTIKGFDNTKSVQKTLRSPDKQLGDFKRAGKVQLRNFMGQINAKDTALSGRITPDTILLRVIR